MAATVATALPRVQRLSSRVICLLGLNPGQFTLEGTNTYLIGTGPKRILLDSGEGLPEYKEMLKGVLSDEGCTISTLLLSHLHMDHIGGVADVKDLVGDVEVFKSPHTEGLDLDYLGATSIEEGQVFETEGATLVAYRTPGHTSDSTSFLLKEEGSVFTGDCILGAGSTVFSHLKSYMQSLEVLAKLTPTRLYCGHGPVVGSDPSDAPDSSAVDKVAEYTKHRMDREGQVIAQLRIAPMSAKQIALSLYPAEGCPPGLIEAASRVVLLHAHKLSEDGVAEQQVLPGDTPCALDETTVDTVWRMRHSAEPSHSAL